MAYEPSAYIWSDLVNASLKDNGAGKYVWVTLDAGDWMEQACLQENGAHKWKVQQVGPDDADEVCQHCGTVRR